MNNNYEFEARVMRTARWMCEGESPEFNMAPTIAAVRQVFAMGFDIVKREDGDRAAQSEDV